MSANTRLIDKEYNNQNNNIMKKVVDLFFVAVFLLGALGCTVMAFVQKSCVFGFYVFACLALTLALYKEFKKEYKET